MYGCRIFVNHVSDLQPDTRRLCIEFCYVIFMKPMTFNPRETRKPIMTGSSRIWNVRQSPFLRRTRGMRIQHCQCALYSVGVDLEATAFCFGFQFL